MRNSRFNEGQIIGVLRAGCSSGPEDGAARAAGGCAGDPPEAARPGRRAPALWLPPARHPAGAGRDHAEAHGLIASAPLVQAEAAAHHAGGCDATLCWSGRLSEGDRDLRCRRGGPLCKLRPLTSIRRRPLTSIRRRPLTSIRRQEALPAVSRGRADRSPPAWPQAGHRHACTDDDPWSGPRFDRAGGIA
jgi:hypothetical protein